MVPFFFFSAFVFSSFFMIQVQDIDTNKDGRLDFQEFVRFVVGDACGLAYFSMLLP